MIQYIEAKWTFVDQQRLYSLELTRLTFACAVTIALYHAKLHDKMFSSLTKGEEFTLACAAHSFGCHARGPKWELALDMYQRVKEVVPPIILQQQGFATIKAQRDALIYACTFLSSQDDCMRSFSIPVEQLESSLEISPTTADELLMAVLEALKHQVDNGFSDVGIQHFQSCC